ncbi:MAG: type II secretion system protein [Bdellovibrionota bacterium]
MSVFNFNNKKQKAFTLIELAIVLLLMASLFALVGNRTGTANRFKEEGCIRQIRETISFLYNQAIADQSEYVLNFNITDEGNFSYNVGVFNSALNSTSDTTVSDENLNDTLANTNTTNDLRDFYYKQIAYPREIKRDTTKKSKYTPKGDYKAKGFYGTRKKREKKEREKERVGEREEGITEGRSFLPAPNFPSLSELKDAPSFLKIKDIMIFDTKYTPQDLESAQIVFSPKGFTDFSVIHLYNDRGGEYTLLINPFTGFTELYNEYKDFEWTFNDNK